MGVRSRGSLFKTNPIDNENGLIGWWEFGPLGSSTSARGQVQDISGGGNPGVLSATNPPQWTSTSFGRGGLLFTPASSVGTVTLNANVAATSLLFWYNPITAVNDTLFSNLAVTTTFQTNGSSKWLLFDGSNRTFAAGPTTGSWNHYAFIYNGTGYNLFTNGVSTETQTCNQMSVGIVGRNSANNSIDGSIASVRIYNRALSADEINAIYNRDIAGFALTPDEWEMPILKTGFPWWAIQNNTAIIGAGAH